MDTQAAARHTPNSYVVLVEREIYHVDDSLEEARYQARRARDEGHEVRLRVATHQQVAEYEQSVSAATRTFIQRMDYKRLLDLGRFRERRQAHS